MKRLIEEVEGEDLLSLLNQRVTFFCLNYIYTGKLACVNTSCVKLEDASIVYETGPLNSKTWQDVQALPGDWWIQLSAVESFGVLK